jgi:hypothetical protein
MVNKINLIFLSWSNKQTDAFLRQNTLSAEIILHFSGSSCLYLLPYMETTRVKNATQLISVKTIILTSGHKRTVYMRPVQKAFFSNTEILLK